VAPDITLEEAVQTIGLVIKDAASRGHVLVLGQGGQVWLRDYQGACHVKIMAPYDLRVARVAEQERISPTEARRRVRASDVARDDYLAKYHGVNWLDPLLYHLVINTGEVSIEAAVSLIVHAAQVAGSQG
jgi:cytidylate kinase